MSDTNSTPARFRNPANTAAIKTLCRTSDCDEVVHLSDVAGNATHVTLQAVGGPIFLSNDDADPADGDCNFTIVEDGFVDIYEDFTKIRFIGTQYQIWGRRQ